MIEKAQEKIDQLEIAIKRLDSVIKHLSYNSGEIKNQVHTTISRHLEALRNREVWLLNQVDLVVSTKEEVLHHQLVRLNKALGLLQSSVDYADDEVDVRLADALEKLDISDLKPEETPYINFRADQPALRESILKYGRVDATGLPLQSAFVAHGHPSTCLPRHFEEYEDADHHVFYKTVEEINRARTSSNDISVSIPRLSRRPEDWLCSTNTITTSTNTAPRFSFPPFSPNTKDWLTRSPPSHAALPGYIKSRGSRVEPEATKMPGDASIQNWLSQIKQFTDLEEEDFEIVERDASSCKSGSMTTTFPVFEKRASVGARVSYPGPVEAWLKATSAKQEKHQKVDDVNFFKHVSTDRDKWIMKKSTQDTETCTECTCYNNVVDIENLAKTSFTQPSHPSNTMFWLHGNKAGNVDDKFPTINVCKANEPCSSFDECLCKDNCRQNLPKNMSPKKWLDVYKSQLPPLPQIHGFAKYFKSLDGEKGQWLKGIGQMENIGNPLLDRHPGFDHISTDAEDWLKERSPCCDTNSLPTWEFKHEKGDVNMWLKVTGHTTITTPNMQYPIREAIKKKLEEMATQDWILKSNDSEDKDNGDEKESSPERWLLANKMADLQQTDAVSDMGEWILQNNM